MAERRRKRARSPWVRRLALSLPPAAALCGASVALVLDADNGIAQLFELRGQASEARAHLDELADDKRRLSALVWGLREDPHRVEATARARLGMVRPGEIVVRMPSTDKR